MIVIINVTQHFSLHYKTLFNIARLSLHTSIALTSSWGNINMTNVEIPQKPNPGMAV